MPTFFSWLTLITVSPDHRFIVRIRRILSVRTLVGLSDCLLDSRLPFRSAIFTVSVRAICLASLFPRHPSAATLTVIRSSFRMSLSAYLTIKSAPSRITLIFEAAQPQTRTPELCVMCSF
jgi:hypothetical protein